MALHVGEPKNYTETNTFLFFAYAVVKPRKPVNPMNPVLIQSLSLLSGLQRHPTSRRKGWSMISPRNASLIIVVASDILYLSFGILVKLTRLEDEGGTLSLLITTTQQAILVSVLFS